MDDTYEALLRLAEQCLEVVQGQSPDDEDDIRTCIDVGEPDIAISIALDIAYGNPDLLKRFPKDVIRLTRKADYPAIQVFADCFE